MIGQELQEKVKIHYDSLIEDMGDGYLDYRWNSGPIQRSHYAQTKASIRHLFDSYVGNVDRLLEVGCGPGTWTDLCLEHAKHVTLFDISEKMLHVARAKYGHLTNVEFVCGDFTADGALLGEQYDMVFSARAIEYMSDKHLVAARGCECLRDGGILAVVTKNPRWRDKLAETRTASMTNKPDSPDEDIQTAWIHWQELAAIFRAAGLHDIAVKPSVLGSYRAPLNNLVGRHACNLLHKLVGKTRMRTIWDFVTESYVLAGRKDAP